MTWSRYCWYLPTNGSWFRHYWCLFNIARICRNPYEVWTLKSQQRYPRCKMSLRLFDGIVRYTCTVSSSSTSVLMSDRWVYNRTSNSHLISISLITIVISHAVFCYTVKRFCEPHDQRRSWLIWYAQSSRMRWLWLLELAEVTVLYICRFFDTSKQGFGAAVIHFANIFVSQSADDPCVW